MAVKGFWSTSLTAGARPAVGDVCQHKCKAEPGGASLGRTKDGVPSVGVASEVEDVRVIGGNDGQSVVDAGQQICPADGPVHFHRLVQSLLGLAFVVPVIDTPPWKQH